MLNRFYKKKWLIGGVAIFGLLTLVTFMFDFTPPVTAWGVTFSAKYAEKELGLDWRATYLAMLDDLKISHLRLSAYWDEIQASPDSFDFTQLDWQIEQASQRDVMITLAVGRRLPRWPECHDPSWIKDLSPDQIATKQLDFVKTVIERYRDNDQIIRWQVENEPLLSTFGICPPPNPELIKAEIKLVRSLSTKPIMITDSGELSMWLPASRLGGDILGTTLYRVVYNPNIGYWHWPLPPAYYTMKSWLVRHLTPTKRVIVAELQTEAWHKSDKDLSQTTIAENDESMSIDQFNDTIIYARRTGMDEVYLWGVEWWYFLKTKQNYPAFWEAAKQLWMKN